MMIQERWDLFKAVRALADAKSTEI